MVSQAEIGLSENTHWKTELQLGEPKIGMNIFSGLLKFQIFVN